MFERILDHFLHVNLSIAALSYAVLPFGMLVAYYQSPAERSLKGFARYLIPMEQLRHKSFRVDVGNVMVKHFVNSWLLTPILFTGTAAAILFYGALTQLLGERAQNTPPFWAAAVIIGLAILLSDFVQFLIHYYHHKVKALWHIHKVHHSPEHLVIGLSTKRTHVMEEAINLTLSSTAVGIMVAVISYSTSLSIVSTQLYNIDAWFLFQLFSFWHLRHSHFSMAYPAWIERWLQSPSQHHLHHSQEVEHWDMNFGLLFSVWDRMFGTFLYSVPRESYRVGLPEKDQKDYNTVTKMYVMPFIKIGEMIGHALSGQRAPVSVPNDAAVDRLMPSIEPSTEKMA